MTNINVLENKISAVLKYLRILENFKKYSKEEILKDINLTGALERYLYLAVQASIDLADASISYKSFRKPASLKESFEILQEEGIIQVELKDRLIKMVGFRNVIAHDYEKVDYDIVYDILQNQLKDIKNFVEVMGKYFLFNFTWQRKKNQTTTLEITIQK